MNMAKANKIPSKRVPCNKMMALDKNSATRIVLLRILIIILVDILVGTAVGSLAKLEPEPALNFHLHVLPILKYVFAALLILAAAYVVVMLLKKVDTSAHVVTPLMVFAVALYLAVTAAFLDRFINAPYLFWTLTLVISVLFAVYYIYTILMYKK